MKAIYIIVFLIIYLEMAFKGVILETAGMIDKLCTLLFSVPIVLTLNLLCNIFKEKISKIILIITSIILTLYFIIQAIFYDLYTMPFSFATLSLAGNAVEFIGIVKDAIIQNLLVILILCIPLILMIVLLKKIKFEKYNIKQISINIASLIVVILLLIGVIQVDKKGIYSAYNLIFNIDAQEKNIEKFGLITSTGIDIQRTVIEFEEQDTSFVYEYIDSVEPIGENEYTGYFKDKNLIFILAESFNSIAVSEELTPTLYRDIQQMHIIIGPINSIQEKKL